jgi:hypothetical protein
MFNLKIMWKHFVINFRNLNINGVFVEKYSKPVCEAVIHSSIFKTSQFNLTL